MSKSIYSVFFGIVFTITPAPVLSDKSMLSLSIDTSIVSLSKRAALSPRMDGWMDRREIDREIKR